MIKGFDEEDLAFLAETNVWVDSCVMLDVTTDYQLVKNAPGGEKSIEETRLLMQRANWLGVALDQGFGGAISRADRGSD